MSTSTHSQRITAGENFIELLEKWRSSKSQGDAPHEIQKTYEQLLSDGRRAYVEVREVVGSLVEQVDSISSKYLALVFQINPLEFPFSPLDVSKLSHELHCMKIIARLRQMHRLPSSLYDGSETALHYVEALYLEFKRVSGVIQDLIVIYGESAEHISKTNIMVTEKIKSISLD